MSVAGSSCPAVATAPDQSPERRKPDIFFAAVGKIERQQFLRLVPGLFVDNCLVFPRISFVIMLGQAQVQRILQNSVNIHPGKLIAAVGNPFAADFDRRFQSAQIQKFCCFLA